MVTAGAGSGKTRTMMARAGYAVRRLGTPPEAVAFITFTSKATEEIRQRTRERLPGLQVGTIHQLARRVLKLVDGRTVQLSPMAEDDGLSGATADTDRAAVPETYTWPAELVAFDEETGMATLRHWLVDHDPHDAQALAGFRDGDPIVLTWSAFISVSGIRGIEHG